MNDENHNARQTPPPGPAPASPATDVAPVETLRPVAYLEIKAAALLLFTLALIVGSGLYLLYARGAFEPTQTLVLTADDSEGVVVGMDMTFSGFPIGRVRRIELAETGNARIIVDVPRKEAHWLRESSVFTLVRGIVGGTNIRAYTGMLNDKLLPDGAVRPVLRGELRWLQGRLLPRLAACLPRPVNGGLPRPELGRTIHGHRVGPGWPSLAKLE